MITRRALTGPVMALLVGCQLFVKSDEEQCTVDGNCTGRGGDFADTVCIDELCVPKGDRCLGHVTTPVEDRGTPYHARLRFGDVGGNPLKGVQVLVCPPLDEQCEGKTNEAITDADGYAYLTAWKNFAGTFQVKNPPSADYLKIKIHILGGLTSDDPPTKELPINQSVRLITRDLFALQLRGANATPDPNAGHIFGMASDCDLGPRAETHIAIKTASGNPILFYFTDNQLVAPFGTTETASAGLFGVANVPEGAIEIATSTTAGKPLGRVTVFVNKDTISNFTVSPTPNP